VERSDTHLTDFENSKAEREKTYPRLLLVLAAA
jgi:hypothetical protein